MEFTANRAYLSDPRRVNEFRKYYQSKHTLHRQPVLADRHSRALDPNRLDTLAAAVTEPDFTLGAYATCVVHSIDADKVMVSMLDDTTQYFLGGATKHTSSVEADENPDLWFGCNSIGIAGGICEVACSVTPEARHYPFYIIPDIANEPQWRDVVGPYRFYAGIPIKTPAGYNIGTLFAFSTRPRLELKPSEKLIMERMAGQVMNHLELELNVLERNRLLLMNQSLAHFATSRNSTAFDEVLGQSTNVHPHANSTGEERGSVDLRLEQMPSTNFHDAAAPGLRRGSAQLQLSTPAAQIEATTNTDSLEHPSTTSHETNTSFERATAEAVPPDTASHSTFRRSSHSSLYARAANILRSGIDCTGVIFLSIDRGNFNADSPSHVKVLGSSTTIPDNAVQQQPFSAQILQELLKLYPEQGHMFYFDSEGWSWPTAEDDLSTSISCQPHLIKYPKMDTALDQQDNKESYGRQLATRLRKSIPAAQQILIAPLKSTLDGMLAVAIAWNDHWARVMTRSVELSFTLCFCANIFAEVLHQEAIVANRQKADFIANVSHELRSPLHGILASSELLKDTGGTETQHLLLEDVQSCGRVLLNTIDHVLDFSNLIRSELDKPRAVRERNDSVAVSMEQTMAASQPSYGSRENPLLLNQPINFNLATLCEDVVDSVYISRFFHNSTASGGLPSTATQSRPVVSLHITPNDWNFLIQPGAIQRIIMNLLGNAIKYTSQGFIQVHLTLDGSRSNHTVTDYLSGSTVILIVSDSGRGLSPDYISTRLWCAFAQEDQTVHGTGLGLSITKRIVNMLDGTIDLQSTVNVGTTVTVKLPLKRLSEVKQPFNSSTNLEGHPSLYRPTLDITAQLLDMRSLGAGRTVAVFLRSPELGATHPEQHIPEVRYANEALLMYLTEWFALRVIWQLEPHLTVDLVIVDQERLDDVQFPPNTPRMILKDSSYVRLNDREPASVKSAYVRRPVAPSKLERAFREVLTIQGKHAETSSDSKTVVTVDHRPKTNTVHPMATEVKSPGAAVHTRVRKSDVQLSNHSNSMDRITTQCNPEMHNTQFPPTSVAKLPSRLLVAPFASGESVSTSNSQTDMPRVLVVDDNAINLRVLSAYLYKHQIPRTNIIAAVNGLEAVQQFIQSHTNGQLFDIVLIDLNMPVKDGFEAITEIRTYEKDAQLSPRMVIALTGLVSERDQKRAFTAGADQFFSKPFSGKQIGSILEVWRQEYH